MDAGISIEDRRLRAASRETTQIREGYDRGQMRTAQFKENVEHVSHRFGVFEEAHTGAIWEASDDGNIYRKEEGIVQPVLQAIADSPDMTDEEYARMIEEVRRSQ